MMRTLFMLLFVASFTSLKAQTTDTLKGHQADTTFDVVESPPEFPGGPAKFLDFLEKNIHYPRTSIRKREQGIVFLTMVVEKDGSLTDVSILRGVSEEIDAEAIRIVKISPKWKPGMQNGKPVRVKYTVPIRFTMK